MRATSKLLALALAAALQPAVAAVNPVELTFEDVEASTANPWGLVELLGRYGSAGVQFSGDAWGVASALCGGVVDFASRDGGCGAFMLAGNPQLPGSGGSKRTATINFAEGFIAGSHLYYSALASADITVSLFENIDGSGRSFTIDDLTESGCGGAQRYCDWNKLALNPSFVARSLRITGFDQSLLVDDISFAVSAASAPTDLPEPASLALSLSALGALGWARRRAAR